MRSAPGQGNRRECAAGTVGLSPEGRRHRQPRLSIYRYQHHAGRLADRDRANRNSRRRSTAQRRHHRDANAVQRQPDRQQDPRGGEPGFWRARSAAGARGVGAAVGRHDLHGLSARLRDRRGAEEQRPRARADAEADPGPLQCRRSDPHRRCAVGGAARRRQDAVIGRGSKPDHHRRARISAASSATSRERSRRARRSIAFCRARCRRRSNSA